MGVQSYSIDELIDYLRSHDIQVEVTYQWLIYTIAINLNNKIIQINGPKETCQLFLRGIAVVYESFNS